MLQYCISHLVWDKTTQAREYREVRLIVGYHEVMNLKNFNITKYYINNIILEPLQLFYFNCGRQFPWKYLPSWRSQFKIKGSNFNIKIFPWYIIYIYIYIYIRFTYISFLQLYFNLWAIVYPKKYLIYYEEQIRGQHFLPSSYVALNHLWNFIVFQLCHHSDQ